MIIGKQTAIRTLSYTVSREMQPTSVANWISWFPAINLRVQSFRNTWFTIMITGKDIELRMVLFCRCDYGQQPCYERDFLTEFTDMGQCYTFNYNQSDFRYAYTTGWSSSIASFLFYKPRKRRRWRWRRWWSRRGRWRGWWWKRSRRRRRRRIRRSVL